MREEDIQRNDEEDSITIDVPRSDRRHGTHAAEPRRKSRVERRTSSGKPKMSKGAIVRRVILILITLLLLIVAIAGGVFAHYLKKADGSITEALLSVTSDIMGTDEPIFVLLLGVSKDISSDLTDSMIVCGYNPKSQKAIMLSIPRDTFIGNDPVVAGGFDKINAVYQVDVKRTVKAVESLTGIKLDYYVVIENNAIPNIVSAVGTVEFDVPIDMNYDDDTQGLHIHLKKGLQLIDKDKAEQLLRFRHNNDGSSYPASYGDNDYGRMRTQRDFMKAIAKNLSENGNPTILKNAASFIMGNVKTNLSLARIISYIPSALEFDADNIRTEVLSVRSAMMNELYFAIANVSKNKEIVSDLLDYLELTDKEIKKVYKPDMMRGQVTPPPQVEKNLNEVNNVTKNVVNNTVNNIVNNTVNNAVNNAVNNIANDYTNSVDNNVTNTVPSNNTVEPTHTHNYSVFVSSVSSTCTADGYDIYKCSEDDATTNKPNADKATGHNFENGKCTKCSAPDPNYTPPAENTTTQEPEPQQPENSADVE